MSWLSKAARKVKKAVTKTTRFVPGLSLAAPVGGRRQLATTRSSPLHVIGREGDPCG